MELLNGLNSNTQRACRAWLLMVLIGVGLGHPPIAMAQVEPSAQLTNGGMESWTESGVPVGWNFSAPQDGKLVETSQDVSAGQSAALIDTTRCDPQGRGFGNLSFQVQGQPYRGQTIRFRASVRTAERSDGGRAQLWFRVDRKSTSNPVGAFDNMQARPITSDQWNQYDIVLKVDDDAERIIFGVLVLGGCKTWFDEASFEPVDQSTPTTDMMVGDTLSKTDEDGKQKQNNATRRGMSPVLMKAMAAAETAPRQPFFTPWLWLVAIALTLFAVSGLSCRPAAAETGQELAESPSKLYFIPRFAFRFSFAYWLLYSFPVPLTGLIPRYGYVFQSWYKSQTSALVNWVAATVFKLPGELVPPNGSGDTTFSYLEVLTCFVLALVIAGIWSLVDWRRTDYRNAKDLLRSYLRYVLAFWMLSYGLSKVAWGTNQFPVISEWQFNKRWGDSSPMNVVWTFMGTSRAYTIFAGLGEVIGGLLIVWRRTATIGALVIFGVMVNVMMLNFCYDVPVKLFSAHLVCMALYVLLPDFKRLANLLLLNRPTAPVELRPPYAGPVSIWIHRAAKLAILILIVALPIYQHGKSEARYLAAQANVPGYFGQYEIEEYKLNGKTVDQSEDDRGWRSVRFQRQNEYSQQGIVLKDKMTVGYYTAIGRGEFAFTDEDNDLVLEIEDHANQALPQGSAKIEPIDENRLLLTGETAAGEIEVTLSRNDNLYRVKDRGFRWINEVPFNR